MSGGKARKAWKPGKTRKVKESMKLEPARAVREKLVVELFPGPMSEELYRRWGDMLEPAWFEQPWNPALAIDTWLGMIESGEYACELCLRMIASTARWALWFLERARRGEVLDYSQFELFQGEPVSHPDTPLGALVRAMRERDSFEAMQPDLERVLGVCEGVL